MDHGTPDGAGRRPFIGACFLSLLLVLGLWGASPAGAQPSTNAQEEIAAAQSEMDAAIAQVNKIVNQPVTRLARTARMRVSTFQPGWFHEGAIKPNFNTVDVRATQESPYAKYEYVTSDLNPGVVFIGQQLEFNAMTKYSYQDRSVPKKKLSEAEMLEINRLYRIIGKCERTLNHLRNPEPDASTSADSAESASPGKAPRLLNPYTGGALLFVAVLVLYFSYKRRTG